MTPEQKKFMYDTAEMEYYNKALDDVSSMIYSLPNPIMPHTLAKQFLIEELKKLRK